MRGASLSLVSERRLDGGLDVDAGQGVCAGRGDEGPAGVEGHVVDGLLALLPVGCDLLDARLAVNAPQAHRAVVTWQPGGSVLAPHVSSVLAHVASGITLC